jgi:hypothetical protein
MNGVTTPFDKLRANGDKLMDSIGVGFSEEYV